MNSIAPDPSPAHPTRVAFEGESLIDTGDGKMRADDTGWMDYSVTGPTPFETTVNVVDGTGAWAGVTGTIVATGELHFDRGEAVGSYAAVLCG